MELTTVNTINTVNNTPPAKPGMEVLDEIGTMLQGLTDELDAMLLSNLSKS